MYNMIKYLLLLTTVVFVIADCVLTYRCYRQPGSPCSQHTLTCSDDHVIAVDETAGFSIAYGRNNPVHACPQDEMDICNATCCRYQGIDKDEPDYEVVPGFIPVNQSDRLSVYRNCSNQPTCTVTSPYSPHTGYHYMFYPYYCLPLNQMHNMMDITDVSLLHEYLYYSGKTQTTGTTITRCCNITSSEPIEVFSVYVDLTEESSYNVKIYSQNQTLLPSGDGGGLFYHLGGLFMSGDTNYHVVFDNLTAEEDDYIWIFLNAGGTAINITCGDCRSPSTASSTDTNSETSSTEGISNIVTSQMSTDTNNKTPSTEETSTSTGKDNHNGGND
ncbi:uncharacterized protein LOC130010270 [Patella vulgata]|uniref:uncharacterized protein LOC130010270 n=1 Tax=Patella vulgata TaxID=6465 RepID=UPI0024A82752|nr:uncharacterized protein LOC130010270 [Patella vulgata]